MPDLYWELDTNLQVAAAEEYLGREYCRRWLARSEATLQLDGETPKEPWEGQPIAYDWIVTQAKPYYPCPPDTSPHNPLMPGEFTWFAQRAKTKSAAGGVLKIDTEVLDFATQAQTLSNDVSFGPFDWETVGLTFEQLSPEGQLAVNPPIAPGDV